MVQRTTIVMPPSLKRRATSRARAEGISFGELVRQAVEQRITNPPMRKRKAKTGDPFWDNLKVIDDDGPADLSVNFEDYLYGGKPWSSSTRVRS